MPSCSERGDLPLTQRNVRGFHTPSSRLQVPKNRPGLGTGRNGNWAIQNDDGLVLGTCSDAPPIRRGVSHCSESLCVSPVAARVDNRFIAQLMHDCPCDITYAREILSSFPRQHRPSLIRRECRSSTPVGPEPGTADEYCDGASESRPLHFRTDRHRLLTRQRFPLLPAGTVF